MTTKDKSFVCPHCHQSIPFKAIAATMGKISAKKMTRKDPDYYRKLQAKRKTRGGGRRPWKTNPPK
jgi:hypothetical protein